MFLLKAAKGTSAAFAAGSVLGTVMTGAIALIMLIGSFSIVFKWPKEAKLPRYVVGILAFGFMLLPAITARLFASSAGAEVVVLSIPFGLVGWMVTYVLCGRTIRHYKQLAKDQKDANDQQAWQRAQEFAEQSALAPQAPAQPATPVQAENLAPTKPKPKLTHATPVIVRCKSCMGKWKSTAGEAKDLAACPKCNAAPNFRVDAAG